LRPIVRVWPPYIWASLALALSAGFGLGGGLFAALALPVPLGAWWVAAGQAHGHVQLFGWAGLMVLGVALHFLPRLRGAPLARPELAGPALWLFVVGLLVRAVSQPSAALAGSWALAAALHVSLALSGALELLGGSLVVALLARTSRGGPAVRERPGLLSVLPLLVAAFAGLWLSLAANLVGVVAGAVMASAVVPAWADEPTNLLAFYGFLVPISVAMSARTFPLYFRTPLPNQRLLRVALVLLLVGLALRLYGLTGVPPAAAVGSAGFAASLGVFVVALGVFARRVPLPRQPVRPFHDPMQLHALSAYVWLLVAAALLVLDGLAAAGIWWLPSSTSGDAEQHALGVGFVTLLIFGVGAHLLPGFANRPLRSRGLVWATLVLGNAAALLRVAPVLVSAWLPAWLVDSSLALAGLAGLIAVAAFGVNLLPIPTTSKRPAGQPLL